MKLIQYTGPFSAGQTITIPAQIDYSYVHIGIQIPKRQPIALITETALPIDITFNGVGYRVNETGILEFDETTETTIDIKIERDLPCESTIDIAYNVASQ